MSDLNADLRPTEMAAIQRMERIALLMRDCRLTLDDIELRVLDLDIEYLQSHVGTSDYVSSERAAWIGQRVGLPPTSIIIILRAVERIAELRDLLDLEPVWRRRPARRRDAVLSRPWLPALSQRRQPAGRALLERA